MSALNVIWQFLSGLLAGLYRHRVVERLMSGQGLFIGGGPALSMNRAMGGKQPVKATICAAQDLSASGVPWASGMERFFELLVPAVEARVAQVSWGYVGSRDRQEGESDEWRLSAGATGQQLLREQKLTSTHGKAMRLIVDEAGRLPINLAAHFAERRLPDMEMVLTVSLKDSIKQVRIGSVSRLGYRYLELPSGEYLWLDSPSSKAVSTARPYRVKTSWRGQLISEKNDFIALCRSDGARGWIVKLGTGYKPFYLVEQEPPKCGLS